MKLINGEPLEVLKTIKKKTIDLIIVDVPYNLLNRANKEAEKFRGVVDMKAMFKQYKRIIKDDGIIIVFGFGMFTARIMVDNEKMWRHNIIWKKGEKTTGFLNANERPLTNHEDIMIFSPSVTTKTTYNPQMETVDKMSKSVGTISQLKNEGSEKKSSTYARNKKIYKEPTNQRYPKSVMALAKESLINIPTEKVQLIPTQKPLELMEYLIKTFSNPGDVVFDHTMKIGTSGIACKKLKRHYIGIEEDLEMFQMAEKLITEYPIPINNIVEQITK